VKAPPQKIVIEQPECAAEEPGPKKEAPKAGKGETALEKKPQPEAAPEARRERPAPEEAVVRRAEAAPQAEGALSTTLQIASLLQANATSSPLATVNPGSGALGLGISWIHIPIPVPRLFAVKENPTITVPLDSTHLLNMGGMAGGLPLGAAAHRIVSGGSEARIGGCDLTKEEIAAAVAAELRRQKSQSQAGARDADRSASERKVLEKKLSDAEGQIERLTNVLQRLESRLEPVGRDRQELPLRVPPR
jgi:hypothetical protein